MAKYCKLQAAVLELFILAHISLQFTPFHGFSFSNEHLNFIALIIYAYVYS